MHVFSVLEYPRLQHGDMCGFGCAHAVDGLFFCLFCFVFCSFLLVCLLVVVASSLVCLSVVTQRAQCPRETRPNQAEKYSITSVENLSPSSTDSTSVLRCGVLLLVDGQPTTMTTSFLRAAVLLLIGVAANCPTVQGFSVLPPYLANYYYLISPQPYYYYKYKGCEDCSGDTYSCTDFL